VAFDWALTVLTNDEYLWLEVDSIDYPVDDVVVGMRDGSVIGIQCKKNHPDFKAWSVANLADEIVKAATLLDTNKAASVRFYSRNNFGLLAKLQEHCLTQNDETSYKANLGKEHRRTDVELLSLLKTPTPNLSTFKFLRRTQFETTDDVSRLKIKIHERLNRLVCNTDAAFNALWVELDQLGARMASHSRSSATLYCFTKNDLNSILQRSGAIMTPLISDAEVRKLFSSTSVIGRSWKRDIAGQRFASKITTEILTAIDAKKRSILVTGQPGSGKTCLMLDLQDALEERARADITIAPLFIQSREFADLVKPQDRQVHGLSEQWVEHAARLAEHTHVIVVIDSLDVLSISREYLILKYFLAQIDRLLLLQNVTVVTACREFDRHYDRQIATRAWDCEFKCQPLNWDEQVSPLLQSIGINTSPIDAITRELIRNPRELALFVEMAQQQGSFNVVTGQSLAQRYLDTIVANSPTLGDAAIQSIESVASEMLKLRSMAIPRQRFPASSTMLRELCSLNVLQENQDGSLTFGHQTLLDVLVISDALRRGITLSEFIESLPPVPFVRPSIRSFVVQLGLGDRRELRKQIRTVLTGNSAFHIRRLVAESLSQQTPHDEDWPLLRDLREQHRDVFQAIYMSASTIEWHRFWLKHLIPNLKAKRDAEGMMGHAHRISRWLNHNSAEVLSFWLDALSTDWIEVERIAERIGYYLSDIDDNLLNLVPTLLERLLGLPIPSHSSLGSLVRRAVNADVLSDRLLWHYIACDVDEQELLETRFDVKLRCQPFEFREKDDNFLCGRMEASTELLDLAVESIERWSLISSERYGKTRTGYRYGFLNHTSYEEKHSQQDMRFVDGMNVLFNAVEASVFQHAKSNSSWWQDNRERLGFNSEGSLLYFAILACTVNPQANLDLIGRMLCNREMLEFGLTYELGNLLQSSFMLLGESFQIKILKVILSLWMAELDGSSSDLWAIKKRSELLIAIPSYLRSPDAQVIVDMYEKQAGALIRQPDIHSHGGTVSAPFSFEEFLQISNGGVLLLCRHYDGHSDWHGNGIDFLVGGEREVAWQLREAASRHPTRFISLLSRHSRYIPELFRDAMMSGVATHMEYRFGNKQPGEMWCPVEKPDGHMLAELVLSELENRQSLWRHKRATAEALEASAKITKDKALAERLVFLAIPFAQIHEKAPISGDDVDLLTVGMAKGDVVEALMTLAANFLDDDKTLPDLLLQTLSMFANDEHPAVRALILRRLPYLQSKNADLGWRLFDLVMQDADGLWQIAEPCLYYSYYRRFDIVGPLLNRIREEGKNKDLETWGRISALAALEQRINFEAYLVQLEGLGSTDAWRGAATVWTNTKNIQTHYQQCINGISAGLNTSKPCAEAVASEMVHVFDDRAAVVEVPLPAVRRCFAIFQADAQSQDRLYGFHEWLNAISLLDPLYALTAAEIYLDYAANNKLYIYDHHNNLMQLITRLFTEAEEREDADNGEMLHRVVSIQDTLLSLGLNTITDWLKAAERP
jgi:hypothetical protein